MVPATSAVLARKPTPTPISTSATTPSGPLCTPDNQPVKVVHLVAELAPFARSGGLGEAVNSLARFQSASGLWTAIVMPLYDIARNNAPNIQPVGPAFHVQVGPRTETARLWRLISKPGDPLADAHVFFVEANEYFARPAIYGPPGSDYLDNARRYACFTMAALQALPTIAGNSPVLLHSHDWHTALAPVYLRTRFAYDDRYQRVKTVMSVHNAGFQGHFPASTLEDLGLPMSLFNWRQLE